VDLCCGRGSLLARSTVTDDDRLVRDSGYLNFTE
jgi:hypothetical protein